MGLGQPLPHNSCSCTGIDEVVNNQPTIAVSSIGFLQNTGRTLILMVVGRDADRVDQADVQLSGDDRCRHQTAPGNRYDAVERSHL
jgi:hypothetical protein